MCAYSTTLSGFNVNRYMTYTEDLDDVDNDELDQYLSGMSTDSGKDFDLVVDQVDSSLSAAACSSSPVSDLTSVNEVLPPQQVAAKTEFSSAGFAPLLDHNPSPLIDADFAAGVPDSYRSDTSNVDELAATFDATATTTLNSGLQTGDLMCSSQLGGVGVCDSSSSSSTCDSMLPTSNSLSTTSNLILPFIADSTNHTSSPFDGGGTARTWTSNIALQSSFPTTNNPAIDIAAISGQQTATEDVFPLPTSTAVKQELSDDIEFSWNTDDGGVVDCDFCDTTLSEKDPDVEDYDGTDLLEVLADVPSA